MTLHNDFTIIIDTREQQPWSFNHYLTAYDRSEAGDSARKSERPRKRQQAPEPDRKARAAPVKRVALFTK